MNRALLSTLAASGTALVLALAAVSPANAWQQVYQWKDANGVTHYSQTPPPGGKFESRTIVNRQPSTPGAKPTPASAEPPQCARARSNIDLINSGVALKVDSDNDGTPDRDINDTERKRQLDLNQIVLRANCGSTGATAKGDKSEPPAPPPATNAF